MSNGEQLEELVPDKMLECFRPVAPHATDDSL